MQNCAQSLQTASYRHTCGLQGMQQDQCTHTQFQTLAHLFSASSEQPPTTNLTTPVHKVLCFRPEYMGVCFKLLAAWTAHLERSTQSLSCGLLRAIRLDTNEPHCISLVEVSCLDKSCPVKVSSHPNMLSNYSWSFSSKDIIRYIFRYTGIQ